MLPLAGGEDRHPFGIQIVPIDDQRLVLKGHAGQGDEPELSNRAYRFSSDSSDLTVEFGLGHQGLRVLVKGLKPAQKRTRPPR